MAHDTNFVDILVKTESVVGSMAFRYSHFVLQVLFWHVAIGYKELIGMTAET